MPPAAVVRPARSEDVSGAARLAAELVRLHHRFDPARFLCLEPLEEGYAAFLATQVDRPGRVFLVAEAGGEVVGYALAGLEGRDWMDLREACGKLYDLTWTRRPAARAWAGGWWRRRCRGWWRWGLPGSSS